MMRENLVRYSPMPPMKEDKRSRSFMTTSGMKTFRVLQPTVNNNVLAKYQPRAESPMQPRGHSTPLPPTKANNVTKSEQSSASKRSRSPRSVESSPKPPTFGSTCSSPVQYYNRSTSGSYHGRIFTPRSLSCTPPHLYMADHVRKAAVQLHRASSNSSRETDSSKKIDTTLDSTEIPTRFGKPITLPTFVKTNPHLKNKELTIGQKQYLWGIARIYSLSHMKSQVQQQYQSLLNYEFKKRMQRLGISEREKIKEMKDYLRYKKFIKNYDQRIPRNLRSKDSAEETRSSDARHIHKHVIKGWTTDVTSRHRYADESTETEVSLNEVESVEDCDEISERGAHIYKHVIKGWTMDPHANEIYQRNGTELTKVKNDKKSQSTIEEKDDVTIYRVDFARSGGKGDIVKISRLKESGNDKTPDGREPLEVIVQSAESNFI